MDGSKGDGADASDRRDHEPWLYAWLACTANRFPSEGLLHVPWAEVLLAARIGL